MAIKLNITSISLLLLIACVTEAQSAVFDVTKYGATSADATSGLTSAWKAACASTTASKIVVPAGTFGLRQVILAGPCKAHIELQVAGTMKAPADPNRFTGEGWVTIQYIVGFTLSGGGTFDGQGATAWKQNNCAKAGNCHPLANNMRFNFVTNAIIHDITSKDSKYFHVNVLGCKNITFQHFTISAPENSPNTDGIHIGRSKGVTITDSKIQTGDDCISIGDGSRQVTVTKVTCGPGHGFSIGSLGKYPNEEPVVGITFRTCTLTNTMNGVRIKSWPGAKSTSGVASDMHFEDIIMNNVGNPVLIDQKYCPWNRCDLKTPSKVKLSKISFKNIRGTSSTELAVKLVCSASFPCQNVVIGDIHLTYKGGPTKSQIEGVRPMLTGKQIPGIKA